jgi:hypothetical protein
MAEVTRMMQATMEAAHKAAREGAAGKVEEMAQVIENNVKESMQAREDTASNVRALMAAAGAGATTMQEAAAVGAAAATAGAVAERAGKKTRECDEGPGGESESPRRPSKLMAVDSPGRSRNVEGAASPMEETPTVPTVRTSSAQ